MLATQQHVKGATAAIDLPGRDEGEHRAATAKPLIGQPLEYRTRLAGTASLAVDHPHAGQPPIDALADEKAQRLPCLGGGHAVQVQLGLPAELAARESSQGDLADGRMPESQVIADLCRAVPGIELQAFAEDLLAIAACKPGFRPRATVVRWRLVGLQFPCVGHQPAEQATVLVLFVVVAPSRIGVRSFACGHFRISIWPGSPTSPAVFLAAALGAESGRHSYNARGEPSNPQLADSFIVRDCRTSQRNSLKILISNDDGYLSTGINALASALSKIADIVVVAPDRNQSGVSNSLTLHMPLRIQKVRDNHYFVNGTPSDCVHLALSGFLEEDPDIVVSGINHGANLGDDVIYSGTVAAAMEGRFLGFPAIAVSLVGPNGTHFDTAARVARDLVARLQAKPLPNDVMLNVNVPDLPYDKLAGMQATRLGFRHRSEPMIRSKDPYGRNIYWIGPAGQGQDAGEGTDFAALEAGAVAVTPLKVDLTRHESLPRIGEWLAD